MTITTRTLIWLGLSVALFAWTALGILIWSVTPSPGPLALFFAFAFLASASTALFFLALWQSSRGRKAVGATLRRAVLIGGVVVVLLGLQYMRLLTPLIGGAIIVLALILEVLIQQVWRPPPSTPATGSRTHTMASQAPRRSRRDKSPRRGR